MTEERKKRAYHLTSEIEAKLDAFLIAARKRGELRLPSERDLAVALGCSRGALRGMLAKKTAEGVLDKDHRGCGLSLESAAKSRILGEAAFVTQGDNFIENSAWAKLWTVLQPLLESVGVASRLVLAPSRKPCADWSALLPSWPEMIIATSPCFSQVEGFGKLAGRLFVSLEENCRGRVENIVAMDNFKAGLRAAQELAAHGCKRPAMISSGQIVDGRFYVPYERRVAGFAEGCRRRGLEISDSSFFIIRRTRARFCLEIARDSVEIVKRGFDSIFLHTDVDLDFLMEGLDMGGFEVPRDVSVVTVNSFSKATSFNPPVSSVSHGTGAMARKLVETAKEFFESGETHFGELLVAPGFHEGSTLK